MAKETSPDKIQLDVVVGGSEARKELAEIKQSVILLKNEKNKLHAAEKQANADLATARAASDKQAIAAAREAKAIIQADFAATVNAIDTKETRMQELRKELGAAGLSANELRGYLGRLKAEMNAGLFDAGSAEARGKAEEIALIEQKYKEVSTSVGRAKLAWEEERKTLALNTLTTEQLKLETQRLQDVLRKPDGSATEKAQAAADLELVKDRTEQLTNANRIAADSWELQRKGMKLTEMETGQLALETQRLQAILQNPKTSTADYAKAAQDLALVKDRTEQLTNANRIAAEAWDVQRQGMKLTEMETGQLALETERLQAIIRNPKSTSAEYVQAAQDLALVKDRTDQLTNSARIAAEVWEVQRKGMKLTEMTTEQLGLETKRLQAIIANPATSKGEYALAAQELALVKDRTEQLTSANRIAAEAWEVQRKGMKLTQMTTEQLALETQRLQQILANPAAGGSDKVKAARELALVKDRTDQLTSANRIAADAWALERKELKLTDLTMEQLGLEAARLRTKLQTMAPNDIGLKRTRDELQAVESRAKTLESGLGPLGRAWQGVKGQVMGATAILGTFFAGGALIQGFRSLITGAAKVSDEFADIQKVTGMSASAVKNLNSEISKIDTRTAASELRGIAVGLGQVGEAVTGDTIKAIDKINLALGTEFGTDAKDITNTISVLRNNLSDLKSGDYAKDVGQIGNAILVLGQAGLATAPVVSDIGTRISGVARQFGISSGAILGTAAAMQELGISTERGSTAYVRLLSKIAQHPKVFADLVAQAGGSAKEFTHLVNTDMAGAFLAVAKASKIAGDKNTAFGAILEDLKTQGVGVSELLSKAGSNAELFAEKTALATEALKNQNAINRQAKLANENLAGQVEKLNKAWNRLTTSRAVLGWIGELVKMAESAVHWIERNTDTITFLGKALFNAGVAWASYKAYVIAAEAVTRTSLVAQALYAKTVGYVTGKKAEAAVATSASTKATMADTAATEASIPVDVEKVAATEAVVAAKEAEIAVAEAGVVASTDEAAAKQAAITATEAEIVAVDADALAKKGGAVASELNTVATEGETVAKKGNVVATEAEALAQKASTVATEAGVIAEKASTLATETNTVATEANVVVDRAAAVAQTTSNAATVAGVVATEAATVATEGATVATEALTVATKVSPWGLIIAGAITAYTVLSTFRTEADDTAASLKALSKSDQDNAKEMYALYFKILLTNKGSKERNDLLGQLKALYPEYLANINLETLSNQELSKSIEDVNTKLLNKAILKRKDDANEEVRQKAVDAFEDYDSRVRNAQQILLALSQQYGVNLAAATDKSKTDLEQLQQGLAAVQNSPKFNAADQGSYEDNQSKTQARALQAYLASIEQAQKKYENFKADAAQAEEARQKLEADLNSKQLGIDQQTFEQKTKNLEGIRQEIQKLRSSLATSPDDRTFIEAQITFLEKKAAALQREADGLPAIGEQVVRTVGQIDAEIKALQDKIPETSTRKENDVINAQIKKLREERARLTGETDKENRNKQQENLDALEEQMIQWRAKMARELLVDDEKELAELDDKHAQELRKYKEQQEKLIAAGRLTRPQANADVSNQENLNLDERALMMGVHADRKIAALTEENDKIQKILGEEHNAELQADVEFYAQKMEAGKAANLNISADVRAHAEATVALAHANAKDLIEVDSKKWDEMIRLGKKQLEKFDAATAAAGIDPDAAVLADRQKLVDSIIAMEDGKRNAMKRINQKVVSDEQAAAKAISMIWRQEAARKLQTFATINSAVADLSSSILQYMDATTQAAEDSADADGHRTEAEIANIKRMKEERRRAALVTIALQTASAIANGIASAMTLQPWPLAVASAIATVATVVGLMAQAKSLMNQDNGTPTAQDNNSHRPSLDGVPLGAVGGSLEGNTFTPAEKAGGILKGPSHDNGGLGVYNEKTGQRVAEFEGDEAYMLMSKAFTHANSDQLALLMDASRTGARLNLTGPQLKQPAARSVRKALSTGLSMAEGGITSSDLSNLLSPRSAGTDMSETNDLLRLLAQRIQRVEDVTAQQRTKLKAVVALNPSYDREQQNWEALRARNRITRKST